MENKKLYIKLDNFIFTKEKIQITDLKGNKNVKTKSGRFYNIHFYSIEKINDFKCIIYFNFDINYSNLLKIKFNGKFNLHSLEKNIDYISLILKSEKNSEIYNKNLKLFILLKDMIFKKCYIHSGEIAKKHGILFININESFLNLNKKMLDGFKETTILDGDEDLMVDKDE